MIKLKKIIIHRYKSFETEQQLDIVDDITVLVGMNESGKSAFLEAVAKSNYFESDPDFNFDMTFDYPRKELKKIERKKTIPKAVTLHYYITNDFYDSIDSEFKDISVIDKEFTETTNYNNENTVDLYLNLDYTDFLRKKEIPEDYINQIQSLKNIKEFKIDSIPDEEIKARFNKIEYLWADSLIYLKKLMN